MPTYTTNYNLTKPDAGSTDWGADVNGNFDSIDTQLKNREDADTTQDTRLTNLETTSDDHEGRITTLESSGGGGDIEEIKNGLLSADEITRVAFTNTITDLNSSQAPSGYYRGYEISIDIPLVLASFNYYVPEQSGGGGTIEVWKVDTQEQLYSLPVTPNTSEKIILETPINLEAGNYRFVIRCESYIHLYYGQNYEMTTDQNVTLVGGLNGNEAGFPTTSYVYNYASIVPLFAESTSYKKAISNHKRIADLEDKSLNADSIHYKDIAEPVTTDDGNVLAYNSDTDSFEWVNPDRDEEVQEIKNDLLVYGSEPSMVTNDITTMSTSGLMSGSYSYGYEIDVTDKIFITSFTYYLAGDGIANGTVEIWRVDTQEQLYTSSINFDTSGAFNIELDSPINLGVGKYRIIFRPIEGNTSFYTIGYSQVTTLENVKVTNGIRAGIEGYPNGTQYSACFGLVPNIATDISFKRVSNIDERVTALENGSTTTDSTTSTASKQWFDYLENSNVAVSGSAYNTKGMLLEPNRDIVVHAFSLFHQQSGDIIGKIVEIGTDNIQIGAPLYESEIRTGGGINTNELYELSTPITLLAGRRYAISLSGTTTMSALTGAINSGLEFIPDSRTGHTGMYAVRATTTETVNGTTWDVSTGPPYYGGIKIDV